MSTNELLAAVESAYEAAGDLTSKLNRVCRAADPIVAAAAKGLFERSLAIERELAEFESVIFRDKTP